MDDELRKALELCETDIDGVLRRFSGDEELYVALLKAFLDDPTMAMLNEAIHAQLWDDAFTAVHALKGLAGNLGFVPLFHATGELVLCIRKGRTDEISAANSQVMRCYNDISSAIRYNMSACEKRKEGQL